MKPTPECSRASRAPFWNLVGCGDKPYIASSLIKKVKEEIKNKIIIRNEKKYIERAYFKNVKSLTSKQNKETFMCISRNLDIRNKSEFLVPNTIICILNN